MAQYHWLDGLAVFILFGFYSVIGGWIVIYIGQVLWQLVIFQRINHLQEMNLSGNIKSLVNCSRARYIHIRYDDYCHVRC